MDAWDVGPSPVFTCCSRRLGFLSLGTRVLLFHWRAGFSRLTMYGPVLLAPVIALAGRSFQGSSASLSI